MKKSLLIILCLCSFTFAHKLNLFTTYENNNLFISTYFANGKGCNNCKVVIKDKNQNVLFSSSTNENGELSTKLNNNEFTVSVDAGSGHIVSDFIKVEKIKRIEPVLLNDNKELIEQLKKENQELKAKIEVLEEKADMMNLYKTLFALFVIALIFLFLRRVKSE